MISFLFWNVSGRSLEKMIANLSRSYDVDVIMLAECAVPQRPERALKALNESGTPRYHYIPSSKCTKIQLFTAFPADFIPEIEGAGNDRLMVRLLKLPGLTEILLAVTHLPSKMYWTEASQATECERLAALIRKVEDRTGHNRTVLVGDLNMNPFEDGVVGAGGLHGVMTRRRAEKESRVVSGEHYSFFYNPMWSFFGDASPGPCGTYHYERAEHRVFFWNIFDQVLVRPALLDRFDNSHLRILESDGITSLVNHDGIPDTKTASDHLPILFSLDL